MRFKHRDVICSKCGCARIELSARILSCSHCGQYMLSHEYEWHKLVNIWSRKNATTNPDMIDKFTNSMICTKPSQSGSLKVEYRKPFTSMSAKRLLRSIFGP